MRNTQNYRHFRNQEVKKLWFTPSKKGIMDFREFVSLNINHVLSRNPHLSKDDFLFLKMKDSDILIFKEVIEIAWRKNPQNNTTLDYWNKFIDELYDILWQTNNEWLEPRRVFAFLQSYFQNLLEDFGLNFHKSLNSQKKVLKKLWEFEQQKIIDIIKILYPYFLKKGNNYVWINLLTFLWDKKEAEKVLWKRSMFFPRGFDYTNADTYELIMTFWKMKEKRMATIQYIQAHWIHDSFFNQAPYFKKRIQKIHKQLKLYCKKHNIPFKQRFFPENLNLAIETFRNNYDLVIWVPNSGTGVAVIHEIFGRNVRYLEWHRNWKKQAIWRNIWVNKNPLPANPERILVCEHDK